MSRIDLQRQAQTSDQSTRTALKSARQTTRDVLSEAGDSAAEILRLQGQVQQLQRRETALLAQQDRQEGGQGQVPADVHAALLSSNAALTAQVRCH